MPVLFRARAQRFLSSAACSGVLGFGSDELCGIAASCDDTTVTIPRSKSTSFHFRVEASMQGF